jgi:hypothetical protein
MPGGAAFPEGTEENQDWVYQTRIGFRITSYEFVALDASTGEGKQGMMFNIH